MADGGVENFNDAVDELVNAGLLKRVLAQTDITFSNSLIESWWRALKHQWLFLNTLDTVSALERLVAFYVQEHNTRLPHSAFRGQTPDEMYFGTGKEVRSSWKRLGRRHVWHAWRPIEIARVRYVNRRWMFAAEPIRLHATTASAEDTAC